MCVCVQVCTHVIVHVCQHVGVGLHCVCAWTSTSAVAERVDIYV